MPLKLRLCFMFEITYFCHNVNQFFGQHISGIDRHGAWGMGLGAKSKEHS
jgi:hypothetical protein